MTEQGASIKKGKRVRILGAPVDCVTMSETLDRLDGFVKAGGPHLIITADSSGLVQAQTDAELRGLYDSAALVTPDSNGVVWAMNRKGCPQTERVSGVDIADRVCALSAERGYRIFFLGGEPGVAEAAAEKMRQKYPGCNIVGARHGYFKPDQDREVATEVAPAKPDFLFVGMGIPRQEKFIRTTMDIVKAPVAIGVGGSLDVFSGKAKRAPVLIQRIKLEWLWRTALNPSKISKAKLLPRFVLLVLRERS